MKNLVHPVTYSGVNIIYTDSKGIKHSENVKIQANQTFYINNMEFRIDKNGNQKEQLKVRKHVKTPTEERDKWQDVNTLELTGLQYSIFNRLSNLVDENNGVKTLSIQDINEYRKNNKNKYKAIFLNN